MRDSYRFTVEFYTIRHTRYWGEWQMRTYP